MHLSQCHPRRNIPSGQRLHQCFMIEEGYVFNVLISHRFQHYRPVICLSCLHFWLCYSWCFQLPHPLKRIMIMQQQEPAWCINFDLIGHSRLCNCGLWNHKTFWMTWSTALSLIIPMLAPVRSPIHRENGTISNLPEHHRMSMSTTPSQFQNPRPPQCICQLWKKSLIIRTCIAKWVPPSQTRYVRFIFSCLIVLGVRIIAHLLQYT